MLQQSNEPVNIIIQARVTWYLESVLTTLAVTPHSNLRQEIIAQAKDDWKEPKIKGSEGFSYCIGIPHAIHPDLVSDRSSDSSVANAVLSTCCAFVWKRLAPAIKPFFA